MSLPNRLLLWFAMAGYGYVCWLAGYGADIPNYAPTQSTLVVFMSLVLFMPFVVATAMPAEWPSNSDSSKIRSASDREQQDT